MMRGEYNTRQKRDILSFLQMHDLEPYTVDDLVFEMQERGERIGRTTVYRHLEALAEQGRVRKYQNARGATQYQHVENSDECASHFHMMCKSCGRLYHVSCDLMQALSKHIQSDHHFELDVRETVLVGTCARCAAEGKEKHGYGAGHASECNHSL